MFRQLLSINIVAASSTRVKATTADLSNTSVNEILVEFFSVTGRQPQFIFLVPVEWTPKLFLSVVSMSIQRFHVLALFKTSDGKFRQKEFNSFNNLHSTYFAKPLNEILEAVYESSAFHQVEGCQFPKKYEKSMEK